ncbi:3-methyl-2-oxobutanoate hydroxymethyltransferase [Alteribacillus bidgolensis]|uniref:3-methyl-2-oxobutanoate hydroxymethyltransferase n=1 Tax=Alteribacillus bidgolensis TaxID=930129 RepID=A0A1G8C8K5_9BACI|nr:3-methyl-2-oxobutanoate hydroxymethyltransferase [Alteribacillus bidgolensis]SDH41867.1 ketopantoate hydroxymethyltransferase [Alteribacillus bidgolensis]
MKSTSTFLKMKKEREPIAMMTAYDAPSAKAAAKAGMDIILVGDSVGMVVHGYDSTIPVTLDDMVLHSKAVRRGAPDTFVVTDLPFLTFNGDFGTTLSAVKKLMQQTGTNGVKLEGGGRTLSVIKRLTEAGVPVMGHLGLTPQSVGVLGGYKVQGKTEESANRLVEEAKIIEENGAFALVLECVPRQLAAHISSLLNIPVIGIGAGAETDGQVLVFHDAIGFSDGFSPKFVKQYANIQNDIEVALTDYVNEVKQLTFPGTEHTFTMDENTLEKLYGGIRS